MLLLVGLGNPGAEYVGTRHNIGFELLDAVAEQLGWCRRGEFDQVAKSKFSGLCLDGLAGGEKVLLLKPLTFMNRSGQSVQQACAFYQLAPSDILVGLDDLALACGRIRLRGGGSSGGHNGLKDIERALASEQYPRLRLGIDPAPPRVAGRDYVLGRFTADQRQAVDGALRRAAQAAICWMESGVQAAMNRFNAENVEP